jgi:hypothetical protein
MLLDECEWLEGKLFLYRRGRKEKAPTNTGAFSFTSGAKAPFLLAIGAARLKPCPFKASLLRHP